MVNVKTVALVIVVSCFFPPAGILLAVILIGLAVVEHFEKRGGVIAANQAARWAAEEPWWTGDEAHDEAELNRRRRAHYARADGRKESP